MSSGEWRVETSKGDEVRLMLEEGRRTVRVCAMGSGEEVRRTSFQPWDVFYGSHVNTTAR